MLSIYIRIGVWAEGSAFWLQIEIKGFEFPELLYFNVNLYKIKTLNLEKKFYTFFLIKII